ncbi:serine hydrolase domain-containing protein [Spirosoma soli]|uniref:Serine hydrolase domain-containing protein n=1 Tax=Spirosoma soli TaxID=1770529 RepID=A0ABW5LWV3_9BACT
MQQSLDGPVIISNPLLMKALIPISRLILSFLIVSWLTTATSTAQTTLSPAQLEQFIPKLMDSARIPGLSMAIINNGALAYSKGYGLTKADSTQKVTSATVFDAASLSKPVFAYAVLQLVEQGVLDLDKPLYEYLPYPDVADDERYKKITARMVLSHKTGFPNWRKNRKSNQLSMLFTPGERFSYSGEGFVYLQKVVEKITGKPINDLMTERVFIPLGMSRSSYVWYPAFDANFALPHGDNGEPEPKFKSEMANMAYSLQTTADDYARFVMAILNNKGLKPSTVNQMLSPQSRLPQRLFGEDTLSTNLRWGLGFGLESASTGNYFWHWGDNGAYKCFVAANPTSKQAVIYFTNSSNGLSITQEILEKTIGGQHPAVVFLGYKTYKTLAASRKK